MISKRSLKRLSSRLRESEHLLRYLHIQLSAQLHQSLLSSVANILVNGSQYSFFHDASKALSLPIQSDTSRDGLEGKIDLQLRAYLIYPDIGKYQTYRRSIIESELTRARTDTLSICTQAIWRTCAHSTVAGLGSLTDYLELVVPKMT